MLAAYLSASDSFKNAVIDGTPRSLAMTPTFTDGSMPRHGMPFGHDVAQQIPVVAGDLHDK